MGTKVQSKSYLPGYHSMRDLNEESNSFNWPLYYGDKTSSNGQYCNGFLPRVVDSCQGYDKDVVKRTMLEHEAIFKNQVYELHRVYRIQRSLMEEIKRKELHQNRIPFETSLSSSPLASQVTSEDARKWNINIPSFPLSNSNSARPSVSGAEDTHSPYSHLKGSPAQGGSFPSQNGSSSKSKEVEVLESRPTKVRRKMFDLHLPADEYIDTEEGDQFRNEKASKINGNLNVVPEGSVKLFLGDASRSDSSLRSTNGLADLNEPVMVEESNPPAYVDLVRSSCDRDIRGPELSAKDNSQFLGTPKEISMNSQIGRNNLYMENGNGRMWFPHVQEIGHNKNNLHSASQGFNPGKFQPLQALLNKAHERPNSQTDQCKIDLSRERTNNGLDSYVGSHRTSLYPVAPSPDSAKSWSQSWEKPNNSLSQRSIPVQPHPSQNFSSSTLSKSSHSPYQSHGVWGDLRHLTSNSRANSGLGKEFSEQNGFYHGSSSGSKELQVPLSSGSRDYLNCNYGNGPNGVSEHFAAHGSSKYFNSSNCTKSLKGVDLNVVLATNGAVSEHGLGFVDGERNHKDDFVGFPWLRSNQNESANSSRDLNNCELSFFRSATDQLSGKSNNGKSPNQLFHQNLQSLSSSNDVAGTIVENADRSSKNMILGIPNFEKPRSSEKECSGIVETNKKSRLLDMNVPCDAVEENPVTEKRTGEEVSVFRCLIDLNSCLSEDEAPSVPFGPSSKGKTMTEIDLEVCAIPDSDEDVILEDENQKETQQLKTEQDEVAKMAAEAILDISSFVHKSIIYDSKNSLSGASMADPLNWFVEIACGTDTDSKDVDGNENASSEVEEVDYFEYMTLKLTEAKAEEYMPEPLVLDNLQETGGSLLTTRPRRGQGRRGRPRRDFQRDILPGLTSLSRHEVTEDLQTFGGMMRATGHSWQSGLARRNSGRNGGGRGRRQTVVSPPPVVVAIEVAVEERSLTGWGKTTRRPRRQRCPAGNPQSLPLC